MARFSDRVAFVTGGGSGIGRSCCMGFARDGAAVAVIDLFPDRAAATAEAIIAEGGKAIAIAADACNLDQVEQAVRQVAGAYGRLDILVNSVVWQVRKPLLELAIDEWRRTIDTCLTSYFVCIRSCAPKMIEGGGGKIVSIASISGHIGTGASSYCAAKGGILAMTRTLAAEFAPYRININTVSPGVIETALNAEVLADPEVQDRSLALVPLGRLGQPNDISAAVLFLASSEADYITGADLIVDGGMISTVTWGSAGKRILSSGTNV